MYILYEAAAGYALFEVEEFEKIAQRKGDVQAALAEMSKFGAMVKFNALLPFRSAEAALQNINDISEVSTTFCHIHLHLCDLFVCDIGYRARGPSQFFGNEPAQSEAWEKGETPTRSYRHQNWPGYH